MAMDWLQRLLPISLRSREFLGRQVNLGLPSELRQSGFEQPALRILLDRFERDPERLRPILGPLAEKCPDGFLCSPRAIDVLARVTSTRTIAGVVYQYVVSGQTPDAACRKQLLEEWKFLGRIGGYEQSVITAAIESYSDRALPLLELLDSESLERGRPFWEGYLLRDSCSLTGLMGVYRAVDPDGHARLMEKYTNLPITELLKLPISARLFLAKNAADISLTSERREAILLHMLKNHHIDVSSLVQLDNPQESQEVLEAWLAKLAKMDRNGFLSSAVDDQSRTFTCKNESGKPYKRFDATTHEKTWIALARLLEQKEFREDPFLLRLADFSERYLGPA